MDEKELNPSVETFFYPEKGFWFMQKGGEVFGPFLNYEKMLFKVYGIRPRYWRSSITHDLELPIEPLRADSNG